MRNNSNRLLAVSSHKLLFVLLGTMVLLGASCTCGDIGSTSVPPDCPNGTRPASSITVQFDLTNIADRGVDKQIRVNGNRQSNQDNCYQPGSQAALSNVRIEGQGTGTQNVPNLQDGNWQMVVQLTGGSSNPPAPVTLNVALPAGGSKTLTIGSNPDGSMKAAF